MDAFTSVLVVIVVVFIQVSSSEMADQQSLVVMFQWHNYFMLQYKSFFFSGELLIKAYQQNMSFVVNAVQ